MRVLVEILHVAAGLMMAVLIGWLTAWSYPPGRDDAWLVTYVAMVAIVAMGVGPLRRVWEGDRAARAPASEQEAR